MFWIAGGNHHNLCSSFDFVFNCSSRIELETEDLRNFFNDPKTPNPFPDFDCLLGRAGMLVDKYATQSAIQASLTLKDSTDRNRKNQVQVGSAWTADTTTTTDDSEPPGLSEIEEPDTPRNTSVPLPSKAPDDAPRVHEEKEGFTGDRVLRNSQIFMQDFGWWIEFAHSIPEGDIGRAFEIMKVFSSLTSFSLRD
jgi:hypothetical protein